MKTKCPMCRRKTQVLHTSALIRALGQEFQGTRPDWAESAVCIDCYDVLAAHRSNVLRDKSARAHAEVVR